MQKKEWVVEMFQAGVLVAGFLAAVALLASCQKEGRTVVTGEIAPQQMNLAFDSLGDFDRGGETAEASENLAALYLRDGYLDYYALQVRNDGSVPVSIYPEIPASADTTAVELHARLFGLTPRDHVDSGCGWNRPVDCPLEETNLDYLSEFYVEEAEFVFSSGETRKLELNRPVTQTAGEKFPVLPAGESVTLRYRLRLKGPYSVEKGFDPNTTGQTVGGPLVYVPAQFAGTTYFPHMEAWVGWSVHMTAVPKIYAYSADRKSVQSLFVAPTEKEATTDHFLPVRVQIRGNDFFTLRAPYEKIRQRFLGLPLFIH